MRVAILFIDGVGVGPRAPESNPLAKHEWLLSQFSDGTGTPLPHGTRHDVDTTFGVAGRPQSASNQTAIFTGLPAPQLIGKHVLGFPTAPLRALLEQHGLAKRVLAAHRTVAFANAYPVGYLDALGLPHGPATPDFTMPERLRKKLKPSASTLMMSTAGVWLRTFDDAKRGDGLTHDIDGERANARFDGLPRRSPADAARVFWGLAADLTLFEHYLADEAGHDQDWEAASSTLATFDLFARAVIEQRPADAHVLICSDHGNVEDLSTRQHTTHPVAVLSFGPGREPRFETVADVGAQALRWLEVA